MCTPLGRGVNTQASEERPLGRDAGGGVRVASRPQRRMGLSVQLSAEDALTGVPCWAWHTSVSHPSLPAAHCGDQLPRAPALRCEHVNLPRAHRSEKEEPGPLSCLVEGTCVLA